MVFLLVSSTFLPSLTVLHAGQVCGSWCDAPCTVCDQHCRAAELGFNRQAYRHVQRLGCKGHWSDSLWMGQWQEHASQGPTIKPSKAERGGRREGHSQRLHRALTIDLGPSNTWRTVPRPRGEALFLLKACFALYQVVDKFIHQLIAARPPSSCPLSFSRSPF